jgi:hypothetical protein
MRLLGLAVFLAVFPLVASCSGGSSSTSSATTQTRGGRQPPPPPPSAEPVPPPVTDVDELTTRCRELDAVSARYPASTEILLEKLLQESWYACDGTSAMSHIFRDKLLAGASGFAIDGKQARALGTHEGSVHVVTCTGPRGCVLGVTYVDGERARLNADEILVAFIGTAGIAVARADEPGRTSVFARVDY